MKAILISAGKGARLYPLTKNTPKCLLQIGNGITILESQLETLKKVGIKDISIITGYLSEQVEAKIKYINDINIEIIYNPFYEDYNNLYSLWMAKYSMDQEIVTINGDDIFTETAIELLLERDEDIVMSISRKDHYDDDDMKVVTVGERVIKVGKQISINECNGESVGIIKYSKKGANLLKNELETMVKSGEHKGSFYLEALQSMMNRNILVSYQEIPTSEWQEMDFHADYELIKEIIIAKSNKLKYK
jgi:choline kinase